MQSRGYAISMRTPPPPVAPVTYPPPSPLPPPPAPTQVQSQDHAHGLPWTFFLWAAAAVSFGAALGFVGAMALSFLY